MLAWTILNRGKSEEKKIPSYPGGQIGAQLAKSTVLSPSIPAPESSELHERAIATTLFPIRITR